jgi:ABC-type branched-subunit amino acid transport system substrate-binding protein
MLDAATLAVFEYGNDHLAITPKDTKGTAAGSADAARAALSDGAQLIIGPLTGSEVEAVRPVTQPANINVVAFSNQAQVAGGNVFLLGFLPGQEAQRIADYAHSTGISRFAVLAPSNKYGQIVAQAFQDEVMHDGGTVDQIQYYDAAGGDPSPAIKGLATNGQVGFDALLIPEPGPQQLRNLASMLPTADIDPPKVRLLGTDAWDVPSLGSEPTLVGGWFAAPPPGARAGFEERFRTTYGRRPRRLATLAYDAVAMASVLQRAPGGSFSTEALCNPSGFAGADGIFRLKADGTAERGLAVLQVERDHASVVSPAPESFTAGSP